MKNIIQGALSATVAAGLAVALTLCAVQPVSVEPVSDGMIVSGTIRWTSPTSWAALNDAGHRSTNIAAVKTLPDRVRVEYAQCATKVSSFQATPDETFASTSIRVGASVGLCYSDIFFYAGTSATPISPAKLSNTRANVWITALFDLP